MNADLSGAAFAMVTAVLLLAFRQWLLSPGKRKRDHGNGRIITPGDYELKTVKKQAARDEARYPLEEPALDSAFTGVDEFITQLRASDERYSPASKSKDGYEIERQVQ